MSPVRAHVWIRGRVQGVSFRYYTHMEARRLGVRGWVRNLWDGRVEAVFEGAPDQVDEIIAWCKHGPPSARVDEVDLVWEEPTGEVSAFDVRSTGGGAR